VYDNFCANLRDQFQKHVLYRWAKQAAQSLVFSHSCGVLHGDIHCNNFFLDENLNIKLGDFAGSSIDQSPAMVCYSTTHQLPEIETTSHTQAEVKISEQTEIFAFGSALYEMVTGHEPYAGEELSDTDIERRFRLKMFPETKELKVLGTVVARCWNLDFVCMADVLNSIETEGKFPVFFSASNPPANLRTSQLSTVEDKESWGSSQHASLSFPHLSLASSFAC